jgi:hypothetical protein
VRGCLISLFGMASIGDIATGMKIRLLADLDYFSEGTEGTVQEVRAPDDAIWHAIVTWSDKIRKRRIRGGLKPNDLDYIEIIPLRQSIDLCNSRSHFLTSLCDLITADVSQ